MRKIYHTVWNLFNQFYMKLDKKPMAWEDRLTFVGYLIQGKRKSTTICSYISAIKAILKDDGIDLNEDLFLITSLTKACRIHQDKAQIRTLITKTLLHQIVEAFQELFATQPYLLILYTALFLTTYYGLFCIGEVTSGSHPIKVCNVEIAENKRKLKFTLFT